MPAFNAPNPYGGYFNFNEPASLAAASFLPFLTPGVAPGVAAAMGSPVGGFNPTQEEFTRGRQRDIVYQQFMAKALAEDPRVSSVSNILLSAMYGNNHSARADMVKRMGGGSALNEMVGFAMGMPGISGFFGGSPRSMALGALGAATGGMRVSGMGMNNSGLFGDSPLSALAASSILGHVRGQFFSPSGASNLSMTQGLNQDQIGGIMMQGGVQGAFAGLNLGKFDMVKGKASLMADSGTMDKLSKFVKDAAKSISSLIDIYGNSDVASLLNKARQITGLDITARLGNAEIFNQRMGRMRDVGNATGVDIQSMSDISAGAVRLGMSYGMSQAGAGAIAFGATTASAHRINEYKTMSGNVYLPQMSQGEFAQAQVRDSVAMNRDPVGVRRNALELLGQEGRIPQMDLARMRDRMNELGPSQSGINQLDKELMSGYGISLPGYISSMGGADRVYENLNENNKVMALENHELDSRKRADFAINKMYRQQVPGGRGGEQMLGLINGLSASNLQNALSASDRGGDVRGAIMADPEGRLRPDKYLGMIQSLDQSLPGISLAGVHQGLMHAMMNSSLPFLANHTASGDRAMRAMAEEEARPKLPSALSAIRGQTHQTFMQGVLDHMDMRDPSSIAAILSSLQPEKVARYRLKSSYDIGSKEGAKEFVTDLNVFRDQFMKTGEGRQMLAGLGIATSKAFPIPGDPTYDQNVMASSYGKLMDPLSQARKDLNHRFRIWTDPASGESMAVPLSMALPLEDKGNAAKIATLASMASQIEGEGGARNAQERAIIRAANMAGRSRNYQIGAHGRSFGQPEFINEKQRQSALDMSGTLFNSASRIESILTRSDTPLSLGDQGVDDKLLHTFSQNKELATEAMKTLVSREASIFANTDKDSVWEMNLIKKIKDGMKNEGIVEPANVETQVTTITGSLKLSPDGKNLVFGDDTHSTESKVGGAH